MIGPREKRLEETRRALGPGGPVDAETFAHLRDKAQLRDLLEEIVNRLDELSLGEYGYRDSKDAELLQRARSLL